MGLEWFAPFGHKKSQWHNQPPVPSVHPTHARLVTLAPGARNFGCTTDGNDWGGFSRVRRFCFLLFIAPPIYQPTRHCAVTSI